MMKKTLGVAIGTSGPGGTNMLTAAGQAKAYHLPVLFITGHPSMKDTGKSLGQDATGFGTNMVKMFEPVTLFSERIDRADFLHMYLRHAIEKAFTGARGPVHLCIPFDVFMEETESFYIPLPTDVLPLVSPNVEEVVPILDQAVRPVLLLGKGVGIAEAYDEVRLLAEHWNIPVITSPCGKGGFPTKHPLCLGGFGLGGTTAATAYLKSGVDVMVVVGSSLSDMTLAGFTSDMYPKQVVHFDYNISFTGKSIPVPTRPVLGDAKLNISKLLQSVQTKSPNSHEEASAFLQEVASTTEIETDDGRMMLAAEAVQVLRRCLPDEAVMFGDDGSHTFFAIRHYDIYNAGTFFFDDVFGAMGHAIAYSIGAKIALPHTPIVCLTGDGCTMMHGTEIATAVDQNASVIFVVINNGQLDMVEKGMQAMVGHSVGTVYKSSINVKAFGESMGALSFRCRNADELSDALHQAQSNDGPTVIEVIVDPKEAPPTASRVAVIA